MTFKLATSPYIKQVLGTFGDVNAPDYDGGFVFIHAQTDRPEFEYVETPSEDSYDCPVCSGMGSADCTLVPYDHPASREWACDHEDTCPAQGEWTCIACKGSGVNAALRWTVYRGLVERLDWPNWRSVAETMGQDVGEYLRVMDEDASPDPMALMRAIEDAAGHYGWHELDSEPLSLSHAEITERYAGFDPKPHA